MVFDPYNIQENLKSNSTCVICHETMNESDYYPVPECGHIFHTDCIVAWFRSGKSNCPLCNDKGVNEEFDTGYLGGSRYNSIKKGKLILKYYKNYNLPPKAKSLIKRIQSLEDKIKEHKSNRKEMMKYKSYSFEELQEKGYNSVKELERDILKITEKKHRMMFSLNGKYTELSNIHICPLIIPRICYMNEPI